MQDIVSWLVNFATDVVAAWGLPGVFVLMTLESACIPVPSEAIMLFAGFAVSQGDMSFVGAVAAGVLGNVVGSWLAYWAGLYGGRPFIDRWGKYILLRHHHLELAERWFDRWGAPTVFFSRMLPIVRTFISLPAGMARMPFWRFTLYTLLGCIPWVILLTWIGVEAGDNWETIERQLKWLDYIVVAAIVGVIVWLVVRRLRRGSGEDGAPEGAPHGDATASPAGRGEEV
jgi:membrane protein DedA with SNARE-associated domain